MNQTDWITSLAPGNGITTTMASAPYSITGGLAVTGGSVLTGINSSASWAHTITVSGDMFAYAVEEKGNANFQGDVKIQGRSILDTLEKIEERLAILRPNEVLEDKWEKLKELGRQYREMEADILEKEKIWKILNR